MSTDSTIAGVDGLNLKWEVPFKGNTLLCRQ